MGSVPQHRRTPPPQTLSDNKYVLKIVDMRARFKEAIEEYEEKMEQYEEKMEQYNMWLANKPTAMDDVGDESTETKSEPERPQKPTGPIDHGMRTIKYFISSASDWTMDHLAYFQVIVLNDQPARDLFAAAFVLNDDDPTMTALRVDGFSTTQKRAIIQGQWDITRQYNPVFLSLMQLSRGGERTPSPHTSPPSRIDLPRPSKDVALARISGLEQESSSLSTTSDSIVSTSSSEGMSVVHDLGPRETLSFTLVHNLLTYLCTVEHRARPNGPQWINWYTLIR